MGIGRKTAAAVYEGGGHAALLRIEIICFFSEQTKKNERWGTFFFSLSLVFVSM